MYSYDGASSRATFFRIVAIVLLVGISLLYISVYVNAPVAVFPTAGHDDGYFLRIAQSLARGEWLGPFNQMTLIKGPGFPLFLAVAAWLGMPSTLLQALLALVANGFFGWAVYRLSGSRALGLMIFLLVLWHPALVAQRIIRDAIYSQLTLLSFGALGLAIFGPFRTNGKIVWGAFAGIMLGWFWLTREEGVWIVPGLAVLVLGGIRVVMLKRGKVLWDVLVPAGAALIVCITMQFVFAGLNYVAYGSFVGLDTKEGQYLGALRALEAAGAPTRKPYLAVSRAARQELYAVSPSLASLRDYFDPPQAASPWQQGCAFYPQTCGDIGTGWFLWALRDAAASKGHYASPAKAKAFFAALKDEVDTACRQQKIQCSYSWIPGIPPLTAEQASEIPATMARAISLIALREPLSLDAPDSVGSPEQLRDALEFTHNSLHTRLDTVGHPIRLSGWYLSPDHGWLSIADAASGLNTASSVPPREPSPDLMQVFGDPQAGLQRFHALVDCPDGCQLKIATTDNDVRLIPDKELLDPAFKEIHIGQGRLYLDEKERVDETGAQTLAASRFSRRTRSALASFYAAILPSLFGIGLLFFVGTLILFPRRCLAESLFWLAGAAWVLGFTRMLGLSLVDINSFPAIHRLYMTPVYALACIAPVLSIGLFLSIRKRPSSGQSGTA